MNEFPNRKNIRLQGYDYTDGGPYFVTICTQNRGNVLGEIFDGEMELNWKGYLVGGFWKWMEIQYPYLLLDEWIIMPNHLHAIVALSSEYQGQHIKTLGRIVGAFKTVSTKHINQLARTPGLKLWQRNYHEHIIRNEVSLNKIREYIYNNPGNWKDDEYYG